ncbi:MAG: DUF362 domain-containing protein [Actinomycetota bacterium]|nr:DUF362 domain-containing protein [Actinomycetota bacterium]
MNRTAPYARDARVHIETGVDAPAALQQAIAASRFEEHVERALAASGRARGTFAIAVKANLMCATCAADSSGDQTDPALVEQLVGALRASGFETIAVVESPVAGLPPVAAVAASAGYSAGGYRIVDLAEEAVPFAYGGVLGDDLVGRTWLEADYRISFGKCKTHWQCFYSGCLANLYGCLPRADKLAHYHGTGHEFYECCVLVADRLPVDFAFLDAWVGGDGGRSHAHRRSPQATRTILASENAFALDWVAGEKMGLDPQLSFVLQEALLRWGRIHITRRGNITTWRPWRNVRPATVVAVALLEPVLRRRAVRAALRLAGARGRRLAAWTVQ